MKATNKYDLTTGGAAEVWLTATSIPPAGRAQCPDGHQHREHELLPFPSICRSHVGEDFPTGSIWMLLKTRWSEPTSRAAIALPPPAAARAPSGLRPMSNLHFFPSAFSLLSACLFITPPRRFTVEMRCCQDFPRFPFPDFTEIPHVPKQRRSGCGKN